MGLLDLKKDPNFLPVRSPGPESGTIDPVAQQGTPAPEQALAAGQGAGPEQQAAQPPMQGMPPEQGMAPEMGGEMPANNDPAYPPDNAEEGSPEEDKYADILLANIKETIFEGRPEKFMELLKKGQDNLPRKVGEMTADLVTSNMVVAESVGKKVPQSVLLPVGAEVVNDLFDFANAAGIYNPADERQMQKDQSKALMYASDHFIKSNRGTSRFDDQAAAQVGEQMRSGQLDSPGAMQQAMPGGDRGRLIG